MAELAVVGDSDHFIFIDDARYYTGQGQFPSLEEIKGMLRYDYVIWHDAIISGPDMELIQNFIATT